MTSGVCSGLSPQHLLSPRPGHFILHACSFICSQRLRWPSVHFCSAQPPLLSCAAPLTSALSAAHSLRLLFLLPWFGSYFPVLWFGKPQAGGQSKCGFHFCFSSLKVPIPAPCVVQSLKTVVPYILSSFIVVYGRRVSLISFTSVMAMPQLLCS